MDVIDAVDLIMDGKSSADGLAAVIPQMVRARHRLLPDVIAFMAVNGLWRRWGHAGPWEYCSAIGVPEAVFQQAVAVVLACVSASGDGCARCGTEARMLADNLAAAQPGRMSPREFNRRVNEVDAAVDRHQRSPA